MNYRINISGSIQYPIGYNMRINKPLILVMASRLLEIVGNVPITLWCRGSSGAIIAAIVSLSFDDCIINHVKKPEEYSHHSGMYVTMEERIHIIIDDFIGIGTTINAIYSKMTGYAIYNVDYLCIFEGVSLRKLGFTPRNIISEGVYD